MEKFTSSPDRSIAKVKVDSKNERPYLEQLETELLKRFPEALDYKLNDQKKLEDRVAKIEEYINNQEVLEALKRYDFSLANIEILGYYLSIKVKKYFFKERLPKGYAYKGGAARSLLLRVLGINIADEPRDFDICRITEEEEYFGRDQEVAMKFMPEDFSHGHGVEVVRYLLDYLNSRDFTINEVLATDSVIYLTKQCLLDTVRHIIRVTKYELERFDDEDDFYASEDKILAKALRFYSEGIHKYGDAEILDFKDCDYERNFINPFWLAIHLDRAFEVGREVAYKFFQEIKDKQQLPSDLETPEEAAKYLAEKLLHSDFYFRHAPVVQFEKENEWLEVYEKESKFESFTKRKK